MKGLEIVQMYSSDKKVNLTLALLRIEEKGWGNGSFSRVKNYGDGIFYNSTVMSIRHPAKFSLKLVMDETNYDDIPF